MVGTKMRCNLEVMIVNHKTIELSVITYTRGGIAVQAESEERNGPRGY